ncbi:gamma carbonic anhydrase family protein [Candidatus Sumerlaeota bacterium]|nr:gamma carbonic anhydrase family protein [Candidatus Sumerlaeota bacterium]
MTNPDPNATRPLNPSAPGGGLIIPFRGHTPQLGEGVFIAPMATVIGRAKLGARASVWFNSIVRADIAPIEIGEDTNIQDNSVLHVGDDFPCIIAARCVVGHRAILHGCRIEEETLIGMGAMVLNGAKVGRGSIIAAGALIPEGKEIPPGSLVMGAPGKIVREVRPEELKTTLHLSSKYARVAAEYLAQLAPPK